MFLSIWLIVFSLGKYFLVPKKVMLDKKMFVYKEMLSPKIVMPKKIHFMNTSNKTRVGNDLPGFDQFEFLIRQKLRAKI